MTSDRGDGDAQGTPAASPRGRGQAVTEVVVHHLEELIFGGALEAGDSLPSEAELSSSLGISRLTIREGIRSLQARGLIEVSHGRRPVVAHPNATPLHDFFSAAVRRDTRGLLELLDVRLAIEVHTAQLAARHATRSDLGALDQALATMERAIDDEAEFNTADVQFHAAIAGASGNRMLSFLVEGMEGPLHSSRMQSIRGFRTKHEDLSSLLTPHREIFEAICARDGDRAARAMRKHLLGTRKDLRASFLVSGSSAAESGTGP